MAKPRKYRSLDEMLRAADFLGAELPPMTDDEWLDLVAKAFVEEREDARRAKVARRASREEATAMKDLHELRERVSMHLSERGVDHSTWIESGEVLAAFGGRRCRVLDMGASFSLVPIRGDR